MNEPMKFGARLQEANELPWLAYWISALWDGNNHTLCTLLKNYGLPYEIAGIWLLLTYKSRILYSLSSTSWVSSHGLRPENGEM